MVSTWGRMSALIACSGVCFLPAIPSTIYARVSAIPTGPVFGEQLKEADGYPHAAAYSSGLETTRTSCRADR